MIVFALWLLKNLGIPNKNYPTFFWWNGPYRLLLTIYYDTGGILLKIMGHQYSPIRYKCWCLDMAVSAFRLLRLVYLWMGMNCKGKIHVSIWMWPVWEGIEGAVILLVLFHMKCHSPHPTVSHLLQAVVLASGIMTNFCRRGNLYTVMQVLELSIVAYGNSWSCYDRTFFPHHFCSYLLEFVVVIYDVDQHQESILQIHYDHFLIEMLSLHIFIWMSITFHNFRFSKLWSNYHVPSGTSEDESDLQDSLAKVANERQRDLALQDVYYGSNTMHTIKKLQPFTSYAFRVQVSNFHKCYAWGMTWDGFAWPGSG